MQYRRANTKGGAYFFTVNLAERQKTILVDQWPLLRNAMNEVKRRHPYYLDAMVILPDHLHAIWTLPAGEANFAIRWMLIKSQFSRSLPKGECINKTRQNKRERGIWQRRYW